MAWATAAMGLEARAARTPILCAAEDAYLIALRWQAAAAAWRASFELLEYAKRVDPQEPVVQQTEQSILDMHNFKQQCQQWGEAS
jgi:hypothetical protein